MKVQLVVSDSCAPCDQAEAVWRVVAAEREMDFAVVHLDSPEGQWIVKRWRLRTVPALVIDDKLVAIGVQSPAEARALVARAPRRNYP